MFKLISAIGIGWLIFGGYLYFSNCEHTRVQDIIYICFLFIFGLKLLLNMFVSKPNYIKTYADDMNIRFNTM